MKIELKEFDAVEFLQTDEDMQEYLNAAIEENDPEFLRAALRDILRAKNLSQLSRDTGTSREKIYKALSKDGNPTFATILKIINALGLEMHLSSRNKTHSRGKSEQAITA